MEWRKKQEGEIVAEFQEVMRQWRRMCATFKDCDECPQYREYKCYNTVKRVFECGDIEYLERNVMSWAAEHKEPVYPTWGEWLESFGVVEVTKAKDRIITVMMKPELLNTIPADIAQKLGIEPKEG